MVSVMWRLWKSRESQLGERVRHLESQLEIALARIKELEEHAVTTQFKRGVL